MRRHSFFVIVLTVATISVYLFSLNRSDNKKRDSRMIDHTSVSVKNFQESINFYDKTLEGLGYTRIVTLEGLKIAGYGYQGKPSFWISENGEKEEEIGKAKGVHFAFATSNEDEVVRWYEACINQGGTDNGKPGPRPHYHPGYYGAFIIDPNGWRIEACFHQYEGPQVPPTE